MKLHNLLVTIALGSVTPMFSTLSFAQENVEITQSDKKFLEKDITYNFVLPEDHDDVLKAEAAKYTNSLMKESPKTYRVLLNSLVEHDKKMASARENPSLPGSFLNACADLYTNIDIDTASLSSVNENDKTAIKIKTQQDILTFASILLKEAKKLAYSDKQSLEDRLAALEKSLAEAKEKGELPKKVYVYSDSIDDRPYYTKVVRKYYDDYDDVLSYNVLPSRFSPNYIDVLTTSALGLATGLIFFGRLPYSYPPLYSRVWQPYWYAIPPTIGIYTGWGGYRYNVIDYVNHYRPYYHHDHKRDSYFPKISKQNIMADSKRVSARLVDSPRLQRDLKSTRIVSTDKVKLKHSPKLNKENIRGRSDFLYKPKFYQPNREESLKGRSFKKYESTPSFTERRQEFRTKDHYRDFRHMEVPKNRRHDFKAPDHFKKFERRSGDMSKTFGHGKKEHFKK